MEDQLNAVYDAYEKSPEYKLAVETWCSEILRGGVSVEDDSKFDEARFSEIVTSVVRQLVLVGCASAAGAGAGRIEQRSRRRCALRASLRRGRKLVEWRREGRDAHLRSASASRAREVERAHACRAGDGAGRRGVLHHRFR